MVIFSIAIAIMHKCLLNYLQFAKHVNSYVVDSFTHEKYKDERIIFSLEYYRGASGTYKERAKRKYEYRAG